MNENSVAKTSVPSSSETTWICVYKDTLGYYEGVDNLTEICVPTGWLLDVLRKEGEDPKKWFVEYTADNTISIALLAMSEGVILDCADKNILPLITRSADISKNKKVDLSSRIKAAEEKAHSSESIDKKPGRGSTPNR